MSSSDNDRNFEDGQQRFASVGGQRSRVNRIDRAARHDVDFDLDLDAATPHQQLGFAGIHRGWHVSLEAALAEAFGRVPDRFVDALKRLVAGGA
jgi:hypothetical protein